MIKSSFFSLILLPLALGQHCATDGTCDKHERCRIWKEEGECLRSKAYMAEMCPVSCGSIDIDGMDQECQDAHPRCSVWADLGECQTNYEMKRFCPKSCNTCAKMGGSGVPVCIDYHENCEFWANSGECTANPNYMLKECAKSCGTCPTTTLVGDDELLSATESFGVRQTADGKEMSSTMQVIRESVDYMQSDEVSTLPQSIQELCYNKETLCSFWAQIGECEANQSYMKINCAPACKSCHLIDIKTRCPELPEDVAPPGLRPGDLNKMFERIVATAPGNRTLTDDEKADLESDGMTEYLVHVISRPSDEPATEVSLENDKKLPPWLVTFENFLTPEECDTLIELGHLSGYKRSEDVGKENLDGTVGSVKSAGRTSENAWCSHKSGCRDDPTVVTVQNRISKVIGIPPENSEDLQMLRYELGQFYNVHHDFIPHQKDRQCGPRILTFFIYLSDVESGGGTDFPELGITVLPKKGSAVLWPSIYDSNPKMKDDRTEHQALPVVTGTKFAANGWIHLYDYLGPQARGCN
eukprot:Nitzschia sp. Nitz4//scaffold150_size53981//47623//49714//NITZ4_006687-RA/size53981-augustus-gene-0.35-mRNA-1//1//CDS//3329537101//8277//frame0